MPFDARGCVLVSKSFLLRVVYCCAPLIAPILCSWTKRFINYHNIVGLVEMSTFIITICFLLYILQTNWNQNYVSFVILLAGVFQIFAVCVFGQLIAIEVSGQLMS